ncbi:SMP-30/gluconolactonase/LRE family protein [Pokkaliibacter sp. CJK22405]|uniref:SMP-30/gluconolactonase/LRE family protein n=1 Tax=Pokkaliibacter sp. CJK22405 TaxID=3384615 RepID=UPI0039851D19
MSQIASAVARCHDDRLCHLGEGAFWHPTRHQFFWFDILNYQLLSQDDAGAPLAWQFELPVSAAGWLDNEHLLIASASSLQRLNLRTNVREQLEPLEHDQVHTRCNDGRADPWGGFWISTMGRQAQPQAGSLYRYYRGELRRMQGGITIPNAICFDQNRECGYFADTAQKRVYRWRLDSGHGWPVGDPELFMDLSSSGLNPDGAVTDSIGRLWCAHWGAAKVSCYSPSGQPVMSVDMPAPQVSCPAFGGMHFDELYVTSAREDMDEAALARAPQSGKTFIAEAPEGVTGLPEPRVIL